MADTIKCSGVGCSLKNSCYRYLASAERWQSWFSEPPINRHLPCKYYWQYHYEQHLEKEKVA